ncbi:hypothetical protein KFL_002090050 [Klebsormidium nitens]|uniref:Uncharacterized protein n=1 Tax=Klebsormidium nitens TaxID=105231 RepID=A0A1Y1I305_KLENI|nr:hypothetical protein KFL_002090050 [Klebsormidium nitens]|eukprot:GAQ84853.1 hypothetical protein KFL_002090050 [Klebsormidium nitens]
MFNALNSPFLPQSSLWQQPFGAVLVPVLPPSPRGGPLSILRAMMAAECVALRVAGLDERDDPDALEAALQRQFEGVLAAHFLPPKRRSRLMLNGGAALLIVSSRVCARKILAAAKRPSFRLGGAAHVQIEWADENAARLRREGAKENKDFTSEDARGDEAEARAGDEQGRLHMYESFDVPDKSEGEGGSASGSQAVQERCRQGPLAGSTQDEATSSSERCILPQKRKVSSAGYSWVLPDLAASHGAEAGKRPRLHQETRPSGPVLSPRRGSMEVGVSRNQECPAGVPHVAPISPAACSPAACQKSLAWSPPGVPRIQHLWLSSVGQSPKAGAAGRSALRDIGNMTPRLASRQRSSQLRSPLYRASPRAAVWADDREREQEEAWRFAKDVLNGGGWGGVAALRGTWAEAVLDTSQLEWTAVWPEQIVTREGVFCFSKEDFHDSVCAFQDAFQQ